MQTLTISTLLKMGKLRLRQLKRVAPGRIQLASASSKACPSKGQVKLEGNVLLGLWLPDSGLQAGRPSPGTDPRGPGTDPRGQETGESFVLDEQLVSSRVESLPRRKV